MSNPSFEIGFAMAGAISAGAYSAGVMDFFFEALDAYYAARRLPDWDGPTHDVRIPVMAGASAGGMTSAICALHAFRDVFDHVWPGDPARKVPQRRRNRLYSSWVEDIDIRPLLALTDISPKESVRSLLCCDVIDRIVDEAFDLDGQIRAPDWIGRAGDPTLRVFLTLTNLRGVPYSFQVYGLEDPRSYGMLNHGDFLDFRIGIAPGAGAGFHALDIRDTQGDGWSLFRTATKATGAFPLGLAPRPVARAGADYACDSRVGYRLPNGAWVCVPPDKGLDQSKPYDFVAVDGGVIDNEPLELARRFLAGGPSKINSPDGFTTDRAVVLVAPFPNFVEDTLKRADNFSDLALIKVAQRLYSAMIDQTRFKPDELGPAQDSSYYSRYIVAPSRPDAVSPLATKYPIACGVLGGFGGFLHRAFRRHDYLLGRRNAQAFLRFTFALPENADLFNGARINVDKWRIKQAERPTLKYFDTARGQQTALPILPLTDALQSPITIEAGDLPDPRDYLALSYVRELDDLIATRARAVVDRVVDADLKISGWLGLKAMGAKRVGADVATRTAQEAVQGALADVAGAFARS